MEGDESSALSSGWTGYLWAGTAKRVDSFRIGGDGIDFNGFGNSATTSISTPEKHPPSSSTTSISTDACSRNNHFVKCTLNLNP